MVTMISVLLAVIGFALLAHDYALHVPPLGRQSYRFSVCKLFEPSCYRADVVT